MTLAPAWAPDGLVPVVVQAEADARVLMLAWMDAEALAATLETGDVHFHSRSRDRLWRKGETSGNVLRLVRLDLDCDGDSILATVRPEGPACHRGTRSCFDATAAAAGPGADAAAEPDADAAAARDNRQGFAWLEDLWMTIEQRARTRPAGSYTSSLLDGGVDAAGRKVTEEATEMLMAAKDDAAAQSAGADRAATTSALAGEAADLVFHALVLLAERGVEPRNVLEVLRQRHRG
ncbi:MAG: bifunctional phosphoribosyl-AMP cyclohydrolase/phosphoribosyl-ATP diphosphatase HisIE [Chloroflexi bacterium]|nr:bifunctional phosphoribosyl-AMP cyclohydrolase/phosphoribosyl-ATP diphosphatase HisIE [Chloroflexota bacterium]